MDPTKENIECVKGDEKKLFSQRQLDLIGQSQDGSFDGWFIKGKKPAGIPDDVVLGAGTGEFTLTHEPVAVDPNATPETPVTDPVDPNKVEKVGKPGKAPKDNGNK